MRTVNEMLKAMMDRAGLTEKDIAAEMYYCENTVKGWVKGRTNPKTVDIVQLCQVVHCTPNELFDWEGDNA